MTLGDNVDVTTFYLSPCCHRAVLHCRGALLAQLPWFWSCPPPPPHIQSNFCSSQPVDVLEWLPCFSDICHPWVKIRTLAHIILYPSSSGAVSHMVWYLKAEALEQADLALSTSLSTVSQVAPVNFCKMASQDCEHEINQGPSLISNRCLVRCFISLHYPGHLWPF